MRQLLPQAGCRVAAADAPDGLDHPQATRAVGRRGVESGQQKRQRRLADGDKGIGRRGGVLWRIQPAKNDRPQRRRAVLTGSIQRGVADAAIMVAQ